MEREEFVSFRKSLNKSQVKIAQLLGVSTKAIHSYEQGWRIVPAHVERQMLFLVTRKPGQALPQKQCWVIKKCPNERKKQCPAWEFRAGKLCWFINGTICSGAVYDKWSEKISICRECEVLSSQLQDVIQE